MPNLTQPFALKAASFGLNSEDYTEALSQVQFDPSTPRSEWRGIGGNVLTNQGVSTWTCTLGFAQDLAATGLLRYLHENEGQVVPAVFTPLDGGPDITAELVLAPGSIGGTAGPDYTTSSVQLGVVGKPEFTDAPAG